MDQSFGKRVQDSITSRRGITILETVIVLIIGGLLISGIWVAYSSANRTQKVSVGLAGLTLLSNNTREFLGGYATVPTDLSDRIHNAGNIYPSNFIYAGLNPLRGNIPYYTSPLGGPIWVEYRTDTTFAIHISVVNPEICKDFSSKLFGMDATLRERGLRQYTFFTITRNAPVTALTPQQVINGCANATLSGTPVQLVFNIRD